MSNPKYSLFIGRFQPLHDGHKQLMQTVLDEGKRVLVLLRDTGIDEKNPFTFEQRYKMLMTAFPKEVHSGVMRIEQFDSADIESVCYGRGVGYEIREIRLDQRIEAISATKIRNGIKNFKTTDEYILDYVI